MGEPGRVTVEVRSGGSAAPAAALPHVGRVHPETALSAWEDGITVVLQSVDAPSKALAALRLVVCDEAPRGAIVVDEAAARWMGQRNVTILAAAGKVQAAATAELVVASASRAARGDPALAHVDLAAAASRRLRGLPVLPGCAYFVRVLGHEIVLRAAQGTPSSVDLQDAAPLTVLGPETVLAPVELHAAEGEPADREPLPGLEEVSENLGAILAARCGDLATRSGALAPHGVLLVGPHGTGKTSLLRRFRQRCAEKELVGTTWVDCTRLVLEAEGGQSFADRVSSAFSGSLTVMFVDNLDALVVSSQGKGLVGGPDGSGSARAPQSPSEAKVTDWLCSAIEHAGAGPSSGLLVIGSCTDEALERLPSRLVQATSSCGFPAQFEVPQPSEQTRAAILEIALANHKVLDHGSGRDAAELARELASLTTGFVGADLERLCRAARTRGATSGSQLAHLVRDVRPSQVAAFDVSRPHAERREPGQFIWNGVGGYGAVKGRLEQLLLWNQTHPDDAHRGIILHGPPGCGKTLLANTVAQQFKGSFVAVKASDLLSKYLGENERLVRGIFRRASRAAPCLLFIDEVDAIGSTRAGGGAAASRLIGTLLTEMDGVSALNGVTIIAATSRLDDLDPALLRPGRLGARVHVPPPDAEDREAVLRSCTAGMPVAHDVDLVGLACASDGASCAELAAVCVEAGMAALRDEISRGSGAESPAVISRDHFAHALHSVLAAPAGGARANSVQLSTPSAPAAAPTDELGPAGQRANQTHLQ